MRLWLLALFVVATLATDVDHVLAVLKTWDAAKPATVVHQKDDITKESSIPKRSVLQSLVPGSNCEIPGHTGDHCIYPVCDSTNRRIQAPETETGAGAIIDAARLLNCSQKYVYHVDESLIGSRIQVQTDNAIHPEFTLLSPTGEVIAPDSIMRQTSRIYEGYFTDLTAGKYTIVPSADVKSDSCNLIIQANTVISVVAGFTEGKEGKYDDFPVDIVYDGVEATLVAHMFLRTGASKLIVVNIFGEDNVIYQPNVLLERFNCAFEYYTTFSCTSTGNYYMQFEGMTFKGNTFRRIVPFTCNSVAPTGAPVSTPAPIVDKCYNHGVYIKNLDNSSYCYCLGNWGGVQCAEIVCLNGGTRTASNTCNCPDSYEGRFCESITCVDNAGVGFDADHPSLMFVVRTRKQMNTIINEINLSINNALSTIDDEDPDYFRSFILVFFNNGDILLNRRFTNRKEMLSYLATASNSTDESGNCDDSVLSALSTALSLYPENKSPLYLITDAVPNDLALTEQVLLQLSLWRVPINFIYVTGMTRECQLDPENPSYQTMDTIAKKSGGMTFMYRDESSAYNLLVYILIYNTVYRSQMVYSNDLRICNNQHTYNTVSIDETIDELVIVATGDDVNVLIYNPVGEYVDSIQYYTDHQTSVWGLNRPMIGNWFFTFSTSTNTSFCNFKIFQKNIVEPNTLNPPYYDLFWAFSAALESDAELFQPVYGLDVSMVAHLTNLRVISEQKVRAELTMYTNRDDKPHEIYSSNGIWRDGCTYNFYFPPFTCQVPDETIYFNFYARDSYGLAIQRAGVISCVTFKPTPRPPSDCLHGGVAAQNGTCYCPAVYTGKHCENINCFNGGTPLGEICKCPPGWTDPYCTIPSCLVKGPTPELLRNYVDMVFAIELTQQGFGQITQLNQNFAALLRDIQSQDSNWIRNFVLVGFNSTYGGILAEAPAWNPTKVIHALSQLSSKLPTDTSCTVQLYRALDNVVRRHDIMPGSYIEIFLTSIPDNSERGGWGEAYEYSRALYLTINGFLAYSPRNSNGFFCNATSDNFELLYDLAAGSTGVVYTTQPGHISDIIRVIPLQYSSGIVFAQWSYDCAKSLRMYFPIDAYVQTIQLNIFGFNDTINVVDPLGHSHEAMVIARDEFSGWSFYEIRKPCDDGWIESGQYCIRIEYDAPRSYYTAKTICSEAGGFLVDDMTPIQHLILQKEDTSSAFWLGLLCSRTGCHWDRGFAQPVPLNQSEVYWYPNGTTPAYEKDAFCVYFDKSAPNGYTWKQINCEAGLPYICQKHRFDPTYGGGEDPEDNVLPAGKWYVDITGQQTNGNEMCYAEARVQSSLQLFTGYTTSLFSDNPELDPVVDSSNNMVMGYLHSEDNENRVPILTHARLWDAYNATFYNAAKYRYRLNCNFPWVSEPFVCPDTTTMNEVMVTHYGEDEFGNLFQRVSFAHCSKSVLTCGNGGVKSANGCVCDEYWTGKDCTIPICVNGGTLDSSKTSCSCPRGYTGHSCQYNQCLPRLQYKFNSNEKSLAIVIEATKNNMNALQQLSTGLSDAITAATQQHPGWFTQYMLVAFNSQAVTYEYYTFNNISDVQKAIKTLTTLGIKDNGNCTSNIFAAIDKLLMHELAFPESQILLFTASTAADYKNRSDTVARLGATEAQLTWIYDTNSVCGSAPDDASVSHLVRLTYATDGNTLFLDATQLNRFIASYLPTRYMSATISNPTYGTGLKCSGASWQISVEKDVQFIYISYTSSIGDIHGVKNIYGGTTLTETVYTDSLTRLVRFQVTQAGIYSLSLSTPGICLLSVYATQAVKVYQYFAPTTVDDPIGAHIDGSLKTPNAGESTIATFHVAQREDIELKYIQIIDLVTNKPIMGSPLYLRFSCTWEYYSDPFVCQSDMIGVLIYGEDSIKSQFKRQLVAFCVNGTLPTMPPVTLSPTSTISITSSSTAAPSTISTSAAPSTISTTAAPSTISTTAAPSTISTTAAPSTISTTAAPSTISTTAAPSTISTTAAPSTSSATTAAPSTISTTAAPSTSSATTAAPSTISTTAAPSTSSATTAAPSTISTTAAPSTISTTISTKPITTTTKGITTKTTVAPLYPFEHMMVDVTYLLDVSPSAQTLSKDIITFINNVMSPFSVGLNYTRTAIIPVSGIKNKFATTMVGLNSITSRHSLNEYLQQTMDHYSSNNIPGQYLNEALLYAADPDFRKEDNGFRPNINNHVLIYVTSTTDFLDKPSTADILRNNLYGVITVGYGSGVKDIQALQNLSGGSNCSFYAGDKTTLMKSIVLKVQESLLNAEHNSGIYCGN